MIVNLDGNKKLTLTEALLELGVNNTHIRYVIERVQSTKESIDKAAMDMGLISPELMAKAIAKTLGYGYFSALDADFIDVQSIFLVLNSKNQNFKIASYSGYIPVGVRDGRLLIAISSIEQATSAKNDFFDYSMEFVVASSQTIQKVYKFLFSDTKQSFFDALARLRQAKDDGESEGLLEDFYCNLLKHGCYYGASDITLWRSSAAGMIKFKKEGRGELLCSLTIAEYGAISELLKTKTPNSDTLKREPKETKIDRSWFSPASYKKYADVIDRYVFRVQLYMTPDTEWISSVIRINDSQSQVTDFAGLDFDAESKTILRRWVNSPTGLILVTGPTGSGKTSVLYSMMREIDPIERSVFTVENPVEYKNGMWIQKVMEKSMGRDESEMARLMLNSLLREAPDVILFGEIRRDKELLANVMDASNTGHLVLSTLHTKSASSTILRLLDIGADPKTIASCLMGILAVRLVGVLCPHCKVEDTRNSSQLMLMKSEGYHPSHKIFRSVGCKHCNGQGYKGRRMVYEILNCGRVQRLIEQGAESIKEIEKLGLVNHSMWERALGLVLKGDTSVDEAEKRIFNPDLAE